VFKPAVIQQLSIDDLIWKRD